MAGAGWLLRLSPKWCWSSRSFFSSCRATCFRCRRACLLRFSSKHSRRAASVICTCRASWRSRLLRGSWGTGQEAGAQEAVAVQPSVWVLSLGPEHVVEADNSIQRCRAEGGAVAGAQSQHDSMRSRHGHPSLPLPSLAEWEPKRDTFPPEPRGLGRPAHGNPCHSHHREGTQGPSHPHLLPPELRKRTAPGARVTCLSRQLPIWVGGWHS